MPFLNSILQNLSFLIQALLKDALLALICLLLLFLTAIALFAQWLDRVQLNHAARKADDAKSALLEAPETLMQDALDLASEKKALKQAIAKVSPPRLVESALEKAVALSHTQIPANGHTLENILNSDSLRKQFPTTIATSLVFVALVGTTLGIARALSSLSGSNAASFDTLWSHIVPTLGVTGLGVLLTVVLNFSGAATDTAQTKTENALRDFFLIGLAPRLFPLTTEERQARDAAAAMRAAADSLTETISTASGDFMKFWEDQQKAQKESASAFQKTWQEQQGEFQKAWKENQETLLKEWRGQNTEWKTEWDNQQAQRTRILANLTTGAEGFNSEIKTAAKSISAAAKRLSDSSDAHKTNAEGQTALLKQEQEAFRELYLFFQSYIEGLESARTQLQTQTQEINAAHAKLSELYISLERRFAASSQVWESMEAKLNADKATVQVTLQEFRAFQTTQHTESMKERQDAIAQMRQLSQNIDRQIERIGLALTSYNAGAPKSISTPQPPAQPSQAPSGMSDFLLSDIKQGLTTLNDSLTQWKGELQQNATQQQETQTALFSLLERQAQERDLDTSEQGASPPFAEAPTMFTEPLAFALPSQETLQSLFKSQEETNRLLRSYIGAQAARPRQSLSERLRKLLRFRKKQRPVIEKQTKESPIEP